MKKPPKPPKPPGGEKPGLLARLTRRGGKKEKVFKVPMFFEATKWREGEEPWNRPPHEMSQILENIHPDSRYSFRTLEDHIGKFPSQDRLRQTKLNSTMVSLPYMRRDLEMLSAQQRARGIDPSKMVKLLKFFQELQNLGLDVIVLPGSQTRLLERFQLRQVLTGFKNLDNNPKRLELARKILAVQFGLLEPLSETLTKLREMK